jgi:hypothetical protein
MEKGMSKIEDAEKLGADRKAAIRFLKDMAERIEERMAEHFAGGFFALAAGETKQLAAVVEVLAQIDLR